MTRSADVPELAAARSSTRPRTSILIGIMVIVAGAVVYSYDLAAMPLPTPGRTSFLVPIAEVYLLAILIGLGLTGGGIWGLIKLRIGEIRGKGLAPISPGWIVPYILSMKRYRTYFVVSTILYGVFYGAITSMVVYQPSVDFAAAYGASFPSLLITPVQGAPLYTPVLTAYIANHLGILIIPLTMLLLIAISALVGLNSALAVFAFDSRLRGESRSWIGGVGAVVGLFTGCPACAGLFFANFLGGTGAVSFATLLGYYQPAFILVSLPVLLATPYLISRSLSKVFAEGCVVLKPTPSR